MKARVILFSKKCENLMRWKFDRVNGSLQFIYFLVLHIFYNGFFIMISNKNDIHD